MTRGFVLAVVFCAVAAPIEARLASGLVDHDKLKMSSSPLPHMACHKEIGSQC